MSYFIIVWIVIFYNCVKCHIFYHFHIFLYLKQDQYLWLCFSVITLSCKSVSFRCAVITQIWHLWQYMATTIQQCMARFFFPAVDITHSVLNRPAYVWLFRSSKISLPFFVSLDVGEKTQRSCLHWLAEQDLKLARKKT